MIYIYHPVAYIPILNYLGETQYYGRGVLCTVTGPSNMPLMIKLAMFNTTLYLEQGILSYIILRLFTILPIRNMEARGLVVERRTPEREVGGSILTQIAVLCP